MPLDSLINGPARKQALEEAQRAIDLRNQGTEESQEAEYSRRRKRHVRLGSYKENSGARPASS
jgi:hypothetical protein